MVRRGLEESCARLAGKGWPQVARTAERVREALRGLGGSVEVESYRGTAIERRWHVGQHGKRRYFIEPAKCDLNVRLSPDSGGRADVAALRICANSDIECSVNLLPASPMTRM